MTKVAIKTLAMAGIVMFAAASTNAAAAAPQRISAAAISVDTAEMTTVKKRTPFRALRRRKFQLDRCRIVRQRVQLPTGRWVIAEYRQCPDTGTLAPRQ
jgi:hypothetical protein